ncbi:MAG: C25 family cysteine peptidase [Bacteroidia bacterium]
MIKHLLIFFFILSTFTNLKAQHYGNEWINYSQKYYKFKVPKNGIYRIDSLTLFLSGVPVNTINPRNFQLFNKSVQQPIFIQGENDGVLNASDFIEFYGEKNDGRLDSLLYTYTAFVPNPYYSLVNDTAVYYLTWNNSINNKRIQQETDTAFSTYPLSNYFLKEEIKEMHTAYYSGETDLVGGTDSRYKRSEGWFDKNAIILGSAVSYDLNTNNVYLQGPDALFKTVVVGASKDIGILSTTPDHHLEIKYNSQVIVDTTFRGYESNRFIKRIPLSSIKSATTSFTYASITDNGFTSNRAALAYLYLKYAHTYDMEYNNQMTVYIPDNGTPKSQLLFNNFNASGNVYIYDLSNAKRINSVKVGSNYQALIPNSGAEKKCFIVGENNINQISILEPVSASAQFTNYISLVTDSAYVIITHKKLFSSVINYKTYRSTNVYGGFHNVIIADINELYDQFAYGIIKSPLSIRGFCNYLIATYPSPPQQLFLIGKSIHLLDCRNNQVNYANCLVPSFGNPSSDNLFTIGLGKSIGEPAIPTGRLAARANSDVTLYLNKVMQYENKVTNPPAEWMKQVLHFGGGGTLGEQTELKAYLKSYKTIIEDTLFGGTVKNFFKTTTEPIQINLSDSLRKLIDNGASLMTFFGHSNGNGFDQGIDNVNSYHPLPGHYPVLLANSCYSGDLHSPGDPNLGLTLSSSESFVLAENKGMIGYIGSVSLGVPYALNFFSTAFYDQLSRFNYGKSIGSLIKNAIATIQPTALRDTLVQQVCYEMTLHGDPAIKLSGFDKPDYKITANDVYFSYPKNIDSLKVNIIITNIGRAKKDSMFTEVARTFPSGEIERYLIRSLAPNYKDTISISLWNNSAKGTGLNKIKVTVDSYNEISELNENNNTTNPEITVMINGGDVAPVYPYTFAIIPNDTVTLKASITNLPSASKNYIFQIDTTDTFNSSFRQQRIVSSKGGVIIWKPSLLGIPNTVYYWRVSEDSTNFTNGYKWKESSFQYVPGKTGWEQAHFFQFKNNDYEYVKFNRAMRKFDFFNDNKKLTCTDGIVPYIVWTDIAWGLNGDVKTYWSCMQYNGGFVIAVIDPITGQNLRSKTPSTICSSCNNGLYGNSHCRNYDMDSFDFMDTDSINRNNIAKFLTNVVPNGYYVLAYSLNLTKIPSYENAVYNGFESIGSGKIRNVPLNRPYMIFGKKGSAKGTAHEIIGDSINSIIRLDTILTTKWNNGYIASPIIGPARTWDSISWRYHDIDGLKTYDSIVVRLIGIKPDGKETTLANFDKSMLAVSNLGNYVSAATYPNIRLIAYMKDDTLHTPPQMDYWQVFYTPVPEAAINVNKGYAINKDTLQEGENAIINLPIQNISNYFFSDSLLITYMLEDANRVTHLLPSTLKKKLLAPNEIVIDTININSIGYPGNNALWVEVNPINQKKSQLEQYHFNNIIRIPFHVQQDKINPLLDVTFDGIHILNKDIVSAKPHILMQLKDENKFLAMNDTANFKIFIQKPNSTIAERIYFGTFMNFIPASLPNNSCKINYTPLLTQDGVYQLLVQARDRSDNKAGVFDYKINFEVINKSTITEVMNYPNPFSTATRFVFTLTGSAIPIDFKIQIMTITGKVVREINQNEIGPLRIGRNITLFAWNGRDQFGDKLANGVYLYRVITKMDNQNIEKKETAADQYFKKGWGKMYLLR